MNQLTRRIDKLETQAVKQDEEMIIQVCFVSPKGQEYGERRQYPPVEEQITEARARGKKVFITYEYGQME